MNSSSMQGSLSRRWKACSCKGLFCCLLIALFLPLRLSGRTVFVDLSIREGECVSYDPVSRDCGSGQSCCYRSLQQAINQAAYGDTILIREGFYRDTIKVHISSELPGTLTIMNHQDEKVVIDGNNPDIGPLIEIRSDRIRIMGLVITHSSTFGLYSSNARNIHIEDCEVAYSQDGGIVFVNATDIHVSRCHVHHNNYRGLKAAHEGISMHNVNTFEVNGCEVHDNKEEGIDAKYGSKYGKICNNLVYRNNGPNIYIDKANLIDIYSNVVHSAVAKAGISLNIESAWHRPELAWTLQYVKVYNNVIYNNSGGIGFWLEEGKGEEKQARWDHIQIINNTIVGNARKGEDRGGGIYVLNPEPENFGDSIIIRNNLFAGNTNEVSKSIWDRYGKGQPEKFIIDHNLFVEGEPSDYYGLRPRMSGDPGFLDPKRFDYSLKATSAAIDAGSPIAAPETDILNHPRPSGGGIDIGAFEYR
jgi:hypothetical protein